MHPALNRHAFLVKEHVGLFKAANNYDIFDAETQEPLLNCREPRLGMFTKMLRFTDYKRMTPFDVHVTTLDGEQVVRVTRGVTIFTSEVKVHDENDVVIGGFKQKFFSIGGAFDVHDSNGQVVCQLKGKWTTWEFQFLAKGIEVARVTKKWAGLGKEFFTTADNYVLEILPVVPPDNVVRQLILASVLCIDMVLKE